MKTLVAENDPLLAELFREFLKHSGFEVIETVVSEEACVERAVVLQPEFILYSLEGDMEAIKLISDKLKSRVPRARILFFCDPDPSRQSSLFKDDPGIGLISKYGFSSARLQDYLRRAHAGHACGNT